MKFTKLSYFLFSILFASQASALSYFCGQPGGERDLKWSNCIWGSDISSVSANLPKKPGITDSVSSRSGYKFEIDMDVNILSLSAQPSSEVYSTNHKINIKKNASLGLHTGNGGKTLMDFKKCSVNIGGNLDYNYWALAKQAGIATFRLEDSNCFVKGNVISNIPHNPSTSELKGIAGCAIQLVGKSKLEINGGFVMDMLIVEKPENWCFRFNLANKADRLPTLVILKRMNTSVCDFNITLDENIKKGKYTLVDFRDKKTSVANARKFTVNGDDYKLGDTIQLGGKVAVLKLDKSNYAFSKDKSTANDLVLHVK